MTRVQQERFADLDEYERLKDSYVLTLEKLNKAKEDTIVLHPLPRVNEISVAIDDDKRACYFKQVANGKYMRMALILKLLEIAKKDSSKCKLHNDKIVYNKYVCKNARCITKVEQELTQLAKPAIADKDVYRCVYCDKKVN
jgi:aspartate carbamoyltransferase catalytic subunit